MNINKMMKQAQEMQNKMKEMQDRLEDEEVEGESGGGLVGVTMTGQGVVTKVKIDDSLISAGEKDVLEDLIVAAVNDAREKVEDRVAEETERIMEEMGIPGGLDALPF